MSKAFTKEDGGDTPMVVPRRAPLPAGEPNYVTARGLAALREELAALHAERARLESAEGPGDEETRRAALAQVSSRLVDLEAHIGSAEVVSAVVPDEVRFGAYVDVRAARGPVRHYQIVGVDEADAAIGRLAFVSPLARALLGRRVGEIAEVTTPRGDEELEIVAIRY